jgi:3-oxoacyl-[acyl-carrier protein] reductase
MRNVLVTGGSRGIGLGIAQRLAGVGYCVVAVARKPSDELTAAIKQATADRKGALHFMALDLGEIDAISAFVKSVRDAHGPIYGLVNNAGTSAEGLLANLHNTQIEQLLRLNVLSPIVLTKYVVRQMMAAGEGRIINIGSIIGSTGYNGLAVYGASKAAANGFTRSLAREVGRVGITVNTVAPGFIETELTKGLGDEQLARIASRSALRRLPGVDDVASMVEFLLGEGGNNITGAVMTVDAGNTA